MSVQLQTVKQSRKPGCNRVSQESRCLRLFLHPAAVLLSLSALPYWRNTLICTGAAHVRVSTSKLTYVPGNINTEALYYVKQTVESKPLKLVQQNESLDEELQEEM